MIKEQKSIKRAIRKQKTNFFSEEAGAITQQTFTPFPTAGAEEAGTQDKDLVSTGNEADNTLPKHRLLTDRCVCTVIGFTKTNALTRQNLSTR